MYSFKQLTLQFKKGSSQVLGNDEESNQEDNTHSVANLKQITPQEGSSLPDVSTNLYVYLDLSTAGERNRLSSLLLPLIK